MNKVVCVFSRKTGCRCIRRTYEVLEPVSANLDVVRRLEWIHKVLDEHRWTTKLAAVDYEDVVVLSEHHGAMACYTTYVETTANPRVNLNKFSVLITTEPDGYATIR